MVFALKMESINFDKSSICTLRIILLFSKFALYIFQVSNWDVILDGSVVW